MGHGAMLRGRVIKEDLVVRVVISMYGYIIWVASGYFGLSEY